MPTTSNFGWTTPADTDLVKDGAAAIRTLGNGVDASFIDLKGGTTGQVLSKASNTDLDFTWTAGGDITEVQAGVGISVASGTGPIPVITNSSTDLITTAGDLLYGTAADTVARLGIGTAGQVLKVNSGATAPEWGAAPVSSLTVSQIATGTLSGANLTVSSLSTYDYIVLAIYNINLSDDSTIFARVNNNSTSNYWSIGFRQTGSTTDRLIRAGDDSFRTGTFDLGANGSEIIYYFSNCKAAGFTNFGYSGSYVNSSAARAGEVVSAGTYAVAEAVSSLVVGPTTGTFSGGNYRIWGG